MKKALRFILLSPIFAVMVLFDIVKFPLILLGYLPIAVLLWLSAKLSGNEGFPMREFISDFFLMGCKVCVTIWEEM